MSALALYEHALEGGTVAAQDASGATHPVPVDRWLQAAGPVDERLLSRAEGPVLDVGCGPGRHVHALSRRGVIAVGLDISPVAVRLARERGARAIEGSIFARVPGAGEWTTALVLDGNIGIGGRPAALLRRLAALLAPRGRVLVELDAPGTGLVDLRLRLQGGVERSEWFDWARVGQDAIDAPAHAAGLTVSDRWFDEGRWFAELERLEDLGVRAA